MTLSDIKNPHTNNTGISKIKNVFLDPKYCASVYLVFFLLNQIQIVNAYLGHIQEILVIWAFTIIIYKLIFDFNYFKIKGQIVLTLLLFSTGITLALNLNVNPVTQIKSAILLSISLFLFYPLGKQIAKSPNSEKDLAIIIFPSLIITFLQAIVSIASLLALFSYRGPLNGKIAMLGIQDFTYGNGSHTLILFGLNVDSNHAALYALMSILLTTWGYFYKNKIFTTAKARKYYTVFFWINLCLQLPAQVLHNSRGAFLVLSIVCVCGGVYYAVQKKKTYTKNSVAHPFTRTFIALLAGILIPLSLLFGFTTLIKNGTDTYMSVASKYIRVSNTNDIIDENTGYGNGSKGDATHSARVIIWQETIKVWEKHPIAGIGPYNTKHFAEKYNIGDKKTGYLRRGTAIHNSYLDVLSAYGLIGFTLYVIFFLRIIAQSIGNLKNRKKLDLEDIIFICCWLSIMGGVVFLTDSFLGADYLFDLSLILIGYLSAKTQNKESLHCKIEWNK